MTQEKNVNLQLSEKQRPLLSDLIRLLSLTWYMQEEGILGNSSIFMFNRPPA
jgi:hypothetical protein